MPLVEQKLLILPEHPSSPPVFNGVRVTRYLVLCVCLVDRCLSFCTFTFGHFVVCSSSIYEFWLPLWYLQTLHTHKSTDRVIRTPLKTGIELGCSGRVSSSCSTSGICRVTWLYFYYVCIWSNMTSAHSVCPNHYYIPSSFTTHHKV